MAKSVKVLRYLRHELLMVYLRRQLDNVSMRKRELYWTMSELDKMYIDRGRHLEAIIEFHDSLKREVKA